jgi:hypothetical protein
MVLMQKSTPPVLALLLVKLQRCQTSCNRQQQQHMAVSNSIGSGAARAAAAAEAAATNTMFQSRATVQKPTACYWHNKHH